ncbi:hypothetical protein [Kribbella sp. DT2]|uniref:YobI family P-loop NTPase n=1 Tax=Kribbella sp. DT2 TaxID=3393427 RepID=UPI003CF735C4
MTKESGSGDGVVGGGSLRPDGPDRSITLRSLAPEYVQAQHDAYVRHLEEAIKDPKNKNIALTGRYGSGKSSVLDEFESRHKDKTLRISINTLGPDGGDEDLTNRIQKELVKQLVYRAEPGKLRRSRFARNKPLTKGRALVQALGVTAVGLMLLWLLGLWPAIAGFGPDDGLFTRILAGSVFVSLVVVVIWVARWLIGDRIVSEVATAGTTVTLGEKPETYFDEFLDEIVAFFDAVNPEFVIFEDLDRFDDPRIFDSLRELNTLINASAHWKDKSKPLRFIYAIKDNLFEQLGVVPEVRDKASTAFSDGGDVSASVAAPEADRAAAAVERANRTKFFELVIPVVPFITHRNARDHLVDSLKRLGLPDDVVKRPLLDLVSRHTTDMRLLINICNEFAVFSELLLWVDNRAPGLTADDLFALVAYKNFHLADFEAIPQRASSLDTLEQHHRDLVRASIERLQQQKRQLVRTEDLARRQDQTAEMLGHRLRGFKDALPGQGGHRYEFFLVNGEMHQPDSVGAASFWKQVAEAGSLSISHRRVQYGPPLITLDSSHLTALFPEGMNTDRWRDPSATEFAQQVQQYDRDIAFLRGADFSGLARQERFTYREETFKDFIADRLKSELARDLVGRGFIGRNYAEYSATFYGSFVGVDVAFFYNHSVQPNQMYLDYEFETPNAVGILLEQVPDDFTSSVSVLNIQIVNHLVNEDVEAARDVVAFIIADYSSEAQTFLDAFLNAADVSREKLLGFLAAHPWRSVFDYLASHDGIPDEETRIRLLDAALLSGRPADAYELNEGTRSLLAGCYQRLSAFRQAQSREQTENILTFAKDARLVVADLNQLEDPLRERVISEQMYELTAPNLRVALGFDGTPTLEVVRGNDSVWRFCRENIDDYLVAIRDDDQSEYVARTPTVLSEVITEQHDSWTDDQLREVVEMSAPTSALLDLTGVPTETWPMVVDAGRVVPTVANVWAYVEANQVDDHLAGFLVPNDNAPIELKAVQEIDVDTRGKLAISILNASSALHASARVQLATSMDLPEGVEATSLMPTNDDLLARVLEAQLVPDTAETFAHFIQAGWESVADAFTVSANVEDFLSPELVTGVVADLLASSKMPDGVRSKVVNDLARYVTDDNPTALRSAGEYAREKRLKLPLEQVQRIARATQEPDLVLSHLVAAKDASPEELVDTLSLLGPPYSALTHGPQSEFELPSGSSNNTLFGRLEEAGRIEIFKKGLRGLKTVRNLM